MRTLFLCLFSILLQAIAFGQGCDPNSCPNITCAAGVSPVCTESGYWVCGCTTSGDSTCYSASDCGSENYSCVDGCCVDNVGCTVGVCLSRADCGSNTSAWACSDGCCESTACTVGGSCGVCGGGTFYQSCACSDPSGQACGGCGTTQCDGSCYDPCGECFFGMGSSCGICGEVQCDATCNDPCAWGAPGDGCDPDTGECDWCSDGFDCDDMDGVIVDLGGKGFTLTNGTGGVKSNLVSRGPVQTAWTAAGTNAGWLVLDLNGDGGIENGFKMFSKAMPQPGKAGSHLGFKALALWDLPANGGNGDGQIDANDKVFSRLRLWVDRNHDGMSEPGEMLTMQQAGITAISLRYNSMKWRDAYGNQFTNRAAVARTPGVGAGQGQWAYDVFLMSAK